MDGEALDSRGLGRVVALPHLREVWRHEAADFTPWLFENLDVLSEAVGIPLTPVALEHPVGPYRLDILADDAEGRPVAVENQVEPADHTHLGQLILYAAHVQAATAIWVSPAFRDEQRQALLWLNEMTVDGVRFFGVEVGVVRIANSPPAPVFNVVVRPNDLQKADVGRAGEQAGSEQLSLRRAFLDDVMRRVAGRLPGFRVPTGKSWTTDIWFRSGPFGYFHLAFARGRLRAEVYLDALDAAVTRQLFDLLHEDRERLEASLGFPLSWEPRDAVRACRIAVYQDVPDVDDPEETEAATVWATDHVVALLRVLEPRVRDLLVQIREG